MACPTWLREFQMDYLKHGIKDRDSQRKYMIRLAKQYEDDFDRTLNWEYALKVSNFLFCDLDSCTSTFCVVSNTWVF